MEAQLEELTSTYNRMCDSSTQQLQQLEQQLAKEEERKVRGLKGGAGPTGRYCRFMTKVSQTVNLKVSLVMKKKKFCLKMLAS